MPCEEAIFERGKSRVTVNHANEQKAIATKSEKWRQARHSFQIAWTNKQKADLKWSCRHMVVTKILTTKQTTTAQVLAQLEKKLLLTTEKTTPKLDRENNWEKNPITTN